MYFVYILHNTATKKFYIGRTTCVNKRYREHKLGKNRSTKYKCYGWELVYVEMYRSKIDAAKRENRLKHHGSGLVEIKKRIKESVKVIESKTGAGKSSSHDPEGNFGAR